MKIFWTIPALSIMLVINFNAFAALPPEDSNLRKQMLEYELKKNPIELDLAKLKLKMYLISSRYGEDYSKMDMATIKSYIDLQKEYYTGRELLAEELNQIYVPDYVSTHPNIDIEIKSVLTKLAEECNFLNKITSKCLNKKEALVFQIEYIKQKTEALETIETGLTYEISSIIIQDDMQRITKRNF